MYKRNNLDLEALPMRGRMKPFKDDQEFLKILKKGKIQYIEI